MCTLHGITSAKIVHVASSLHASPVVLMVMIQDITETSVNFYNATSCHFPEDDTLKPLPSTGCHIISQSHF